MLVAIVLVTGCNSPRRLSYMMDMAYDVPFVAKPAPELFVQRGDRLEIQVFSSVPELTAPFRTQAGQAETMVGDVYLVERDGCIVFPTLGSISVEGKTLNEVRKTITELIQTGGYIKEPMVRVRLANFSVTVIGNAGNTVIPVEDSDINLLQVIARSGRTSGNTNIREVTVIRNERGFRTAYKVNLQTKELFDSPVFYLQQNDIVYIKPQGFQLSSEGQVVMSFVTSGLSLVSIITNFLIWYSRR